MRSIEPIRRSLRQLPIVRMLKQTFLKTQGTWAVLGAGSWGTALALHMAPQCQRVVLWGRDPQKMADMAAAGENTVYLPGFAFPKNVEVRSDLAQALKRSDDVLIAVPSAVFEETLAQMAVCLPSLKRILSVTKGLTRQGGWLSEALIQTWPGVELAIVSGPSFAKEVALGRPTAVTLASNASTWSKHCQALLNTPVFRCYASDDLIGVQLGGVVKNVLAIAVGVSDGLECGVNARSALVTRGLAELVRLGTALGARLETFMGLSGIGDLMLSATDNQSRNRRFGLLLGQGFSKGQACAAIQQVIEGIENAEHLAALAQRNGVDMPIVAQVAALVREETTPQAAMEALLLRPVGEE